MSAVLFQPSICEAIPASVRHATEIRADAALAAIAVAWDPAAMSANKRLHWRALDRLKGCARDAASLGWNLAGGPVLDVPVYVDVLIFRCRRMDDDNVFSGLKTVRDQLCDSPRRGGHGMLPSDAHQWWMYRQIRFFTHSSYGRTGRDGPWTVFILSARPQPDGPRGLRVEGP